MTDSTSKTPDTNPGANVESSNGDEDLSEYTVTINGIEHSMMLTKQDAERYGDDAKKGSGKTSTKARTPDNKGQG